MSPLDQVALVLVVVGALNWGLIGIFDWNLVSWLFAFSAVVERVVYILVGLAAVYVAVSGCSAGKGKK